MLICFTIKIYKLVVTSDSLLRQQLLFLQHPFLYFVLLLRLRRLFALGLLTGAFRLRLLHVLHAELLLLVLIPLAVIGCLLDEGSLDHWVQLLPLSRDQTGKL